MCRRVGDGRNTGYRWRAERGGLAPLRLAESVRGLRYPSHFQRQRIATLRAAGTSLNGQSQSDDILIDVRRHWYGAKVEDDGRRVRARRAGVRDGRRRL